MKPVNNIWSATVWISKIHVQLMCTPSTLDFPCSYCKNSQNSCSVNQTALLHCVYFSNQIKTITANLEKRSQNTSSACNPHTPPAKWITNKLDPDCFPKAWHESSKQWDEGKSCYKAQTSEVYLIMSHAYTITFYASFLCISIPRTAKPQWLLRCTQTLSYKISYANRS